MATTTRKQARALKRGDSFPMVWNGRSVTVEVDEGISTATARTARTNREFVEFIGSVRDRGTSTRTTITLWADEYVRVTHKSSNSDVLF